MQNAQKQFPGVRVFGTIGWIAAGVIVGHVLQAEQTALPIRLAATASLLYGLFAFTLPDTPPRAGQQKTSLASLLGLDAIRLGDRSFWALIACSLLMMVPLSFYYAYANAFLVEVGVRNAASVQSIGQVSEIFFLLLLPFFLRWVGMKGVLLIGMLAWSARYILFANGFDIDGPVMWALLLGLALHGVCFDFFLVAGTIWVDTHFPQEMRGRAQSFLALVTWGAGSVIGSLLANRIYILHTDSAGSHLWHSFWLVPAILSLATALAFLFLFRDRRAKATV